MAEVAEIFKFSLLVLFAAVIAFAHAQSSEQMVEKKLSLLSSMLQTRKVNDRNPQVTQECFNYYGHLLDNATTDYSRTYAGCYIDAEKRKNDTEDYSTAQRMEYFKVASSTCSEFVACDNRPTILEVFECYAYSGNPASQAIRDVGANAAMTHGYLRKTWSDIETDRTLCLAKAEHTYNEQTDGIFTKLQSCLSDNNPKLESGSSNSASPMRPPSNFLKSP